MVFHIELFSWQASVGKVKDTKKRLKASELLAQAGSYLLGPFLGEFAKLMRLAHSDIDLGKL